MGNSKIEVAIQLKKNLKKAFDQLEDFWIENAPEVDVFLSKEYPFDESFDNVSIKVSKWVKTEVVNS